jgi:hypothetical protein
VAAAQATDTISQSLGVDNMKSNYCAGDRRMSQAGPSGQDGFQYGIPLGNLLGLHKNKKISLVQIPGEGVQSRRRRISSSRGSKSGRSCERSSLTSTRPETPTEQLNFGTLAIQTPPNKTNTEGGKISYSIILKDVLGNLFGPHKNKKFAALCNPGVLLWRLRGRSSRSSAL